ncbi:formin-like protein 20 [Bidens hawaiensis]|uniref:formin-like protein 20 n=1 Tax=Bidens hawaiensis TaxID=980011 RepID=UPI00404AEC1C
MSLLRRFFYPKPPIPKRLIEISERLYVFDCCFLTEALGVLEYTFYINGIASELQDSYPDSSFMVFNFKEGDRRTQISGILSQLDMTEMEYPRQYAGCSMLPLEMIHHFLRSCESWLSLEGQQNVILVHCERGGWPVLAFMLAAFLLFRKQYFGEQKTLEMMYKQAPRELLHVLTPLNPQSSQLRYLQYISRRNLNADWLPSDTPLVLDHIILGFLPLIGEKGCRPVIRIYGRDSSSTTANRVSKLLFTSKKPVHYYQPEECELVKIDIDHRVQGDVVLECIHLDHVTEEMIFRVMFHTTFVRSNVLFLNRDEVDVMWDARDKFPENFRAEVLFSYADNLASMITAEKVFEDTNETERPTHEEFIELEEVFSNVVDGQDDLLREVKADPKNGDIAPPPPPPPSPPPPPILAAPFPQIMAPFLKEFEHLKIQLEDIKSATDNFGENKVIGRGGFGKVYLGEVYHSKGKSMGAFKRLNPRLGQGEPEFWKEILMLSGYKHKNVISLLGYCDEGGERVLVYEYASNGSLDRHLSSTRLTWIQRIKICLDAARGLRFLHDDKGTI